MAVGSNDELRLIAYRYLQSASSVVSPAQEAYPLGPASPRESWKISSVMFEQQDLVI